MPLDDLSPSKGLVEGGDERLRKPEGEDQLGARHEQLILSC